MLKSILIPGALLLLSLFAAAQPVRGDQNCTFTIARLHYSGGGDWYCDPSSLPNLADAVRARTEIPVCDTITNVRINEERFFSFPFIYISGHGNIRFSQKERLRLRQYLSRGGFIWADDNYGLDEPLRRELKKLFPENSLTEIRSNHPLFSSEYRLKGVPKIHEHDGDPARAYGIYFNDRLVFLYTHSADIGDGMEDTEVHKDGKDLHETALKMGVNIISWFFNPEES
ncbi:MAG: DUF4159 domain-containing protein [Chitinivibrionales bacterium]